MLKLSDNPVKLADGLVKASNTEKGLYRRHWEENIEFSSGMFYGKKDWPKSGSTNYKSEGEKKRSEKGYDTPYNLVGPANQRSMARTSELFVGFSVTPGSGSLDDEQTTERASEFLEGYFQQNDIYSVCLEATRWAIMTSRSFVKCEGDETLGKKRSAWDETTEQNIEFGEGDVIIDLATALQVGVWPGVRKTSKSPAMTLDEWLTAEEIERRWNFDVESVGQAELEMPAELVRFYPSANEGVYHIRRLWIRPCKQYELGAQFVIYGKQLISEIKNREGKHWIGTKSNDIPLIDFADVRAHEGYWGRGRQTLAKPMQKVANKVWAKAVNIADSTGVLIGIPLGSELKKSDINNKPISTVMYNPAGGGLQYWSSPKLELHSWILAQCRYLVDDIYAQHDASKGMIPGSRTAPGTMQKAIEQDMLADSPLGKTLSMSVSKLGQWSLEEGQRVWPKKKLAYMFDERGEQKAVEFQTDMLGDGYNVFIQPDSGLPHGRKAKSEAVKEAFRYEMLGDPKHPRVQARAQKLAGMMVPEEFADPDRRDRSVAREEDKMFKQGELLPVNDFDNDYVHVEVHDRCAKDRFGTASPGEVMARRAHRAMHQGRIIGALQAGAPPGVSPADVLPPEQPQGPMGPPAGAMPGAPGGAPAVPGAPAQAQLPPPGAPAPGPMAPGAMPGAMPGAGGGF